MHEAFMINNFALSLSHAQAAVDTFVTYAHCSFEPVGPEKGFILASAKASGRWSKSWCNNKKTMVFYNHRHKHYVRDLALS